MSYDAYYESEQISLSVRPLNGPRLSEFPLYVSSLFSPLIHMRVRLREKGSAAWTRFESNAFPVGTLLVRSDGTVDARLPTDDV
jgi:hypothetical protein